jgi:hypothetical protein
MKDDMTKISGDLKSTKAKAKRQDHTEEESVTIKEQNSIDEEDASDEDYFSQVERQRKQMLTVFKFFDGLDDLLEK